MEYCNFERRKAHEATEATASDATLQLEVVDSWRRGAEAARPPGEGGVEARVWNVHVLGGRCGSSLVEHLDQPPSPEIFRA